MFLSKTKGRSPRAQSKGRVELPGRVEQRGQQHTHYKGRDTPWDTLTPVVLVAAGLIGVGQSEGPEESRLSKLRPYDGSRCAEHGGVAGTDWHDVRVPPGVVMVAPQTRLRNQREREAKGRARGRRKARGQGKYKGRSPCVRMYGAPATSAGTPRRLRAQEPRPATSIKAGARRLPRPDCLLYALQRRHGTRMYSISSSPSANSSTCPRKCQPS